MTRGNIALGGRQKPRNAAPCNIGKLYARSLIICRIGKQENACAELAVMHIEAQGIQNIGKIQHVIDLKIVSVIACGARFNQNVDKLGIARQPCRQARGHADNIDQKFERIVI